MKILVKVKAGMDAHFRNTVKGYDKGAVTMRPDPSSPWDYIIENFAACPVDEVGRWQSVEKAATDAPPKPKELMLSHLASMIEAQNKALNRPRSWMYKMRTQRGEGNRDSFELRIAANKSCFRIDEGSSAACSLDMVLDLANKYGNLPLKARQSEIPKDMKIIDGSDKADRIVFYF
jgi:hypothetical protein